MLINPTLSSRRWVFRGWDQFWEDALIEAVSRTSRYFHQISEVVPKGRQGIASKLGSGNVSQSHSIDKLEAPTVNEGRVVVLNGVLNVSGDVVHDLKCLFEVVTELDLLLILQKTIRFSSIRKFLHMLFGWPTPSIQSVQLDCDNLSMLCQLTGFELTRAEAVWPRGLGFLKRFHFLDRLSPYSVSCIRRQCRKAQWPTVSILIPMRNEAGNIPALFEGINKLECLPGLEVILVEGNSTDGTEDILRYYVDGYQGSAQIRLIKQSGRGKAEAVRMGLQQATNEIFMILDSDLTVAPSELFKFYEAISRFKSDLIVGNRMFYSQEKGAMRPFNYVGNRFFTLLVNQLFQLRLSDLLCGVKVMRKLDYSRFQNWVLNKGVEDPFGDFELIFAAAGMGLRILEIPVHYRARRYGATNIHRVRDGFRLLKMTLRAAFVS